MSATPRGIDRIDMGIASHLFESWPAPCYGVVPSLIGPRLISRDRVLRGRDRLLSLWREQTSAEEDPAYHRVLAQLTGAPLPPQARAARKAPRWHGLHRALTLLFADGIEMGTPVSALPQGSLYLDMGHDGLAFAPMTRWLDKRADVAPVFLIHDLIPLLHPEVEKTATIRRHRTLMVEASQRARRLITATPSVARDLETYMAAHGLRMPPVSPCALPLEEGFLAARAMEPKLAGRRYFIVCGTLEPRKNQLMLLQLWKRLVQVHGPQTPILLLVGASGASGPEIATELARSPALAQVVVQVSGLSSGGLARLLAGARALLMPSMAEGFGLPPLEAMACGTPAVLSDIPAHRDSAGNFGWFLPPTAPDAWYTAVEALAFDDAAFERSKAAIAGFRPTDWPSYLRALEAILLQV